MSKRHVWQDWHCHFHQADRYEELVGKRLCGSAFTPFQTKHDFQIEKK
jgi:hypothetical protein